jgi:hypothetical protein
MKKFSDLPPFGFATPPYIRHARLAHVAETNTIIAINGTTLNRFVNDNITTFEYVRYNEYIALFINSVPNDSYIPEHLITLL